MFVLYNHIAGHRKNEGGLTHRRTGCNNNQVRILPTGSNLIQLSKTTRNPTKSIFTLTGNFDMLNSFRDNTLNLYGISLHAALRKHEQGVLCLFKQIINILRLIKSLGLYNTRDTYHLTLQILLVYDTGVILNVCGRGYPAG